LNKYMITLVLVTIIYAIVMIIAQMISGKYDADETKIKSRTRRGINRHQRKASELKGNLVNMLTEKTSVSKRYKVETMCLQAGKELSFGEFKILCISLSIALPLLMLIIMKNVYLAFVFAIIGYNIPGQYFQMKANNRVIKMENQVGAFIRIVLERYKSNKDLSKSIVQTLPDFRGNEPFYSELKKTVVEINIGMPTTEALSNLARRTGSKYLLRFSDYYQITENLATHQSKVELLNQAFLQFEEQRKMKSMLKEKIAGPVRESYIMVLATPIFMTYQSFSTEGYLEFMLYEKMGQAGMAGVVLVLLGCIWFINAKIGAPLE